MRVIISPAKKMKIDSDYLEYQYIPKLMTNTEKILTYLQGLSYEEAKTLWKCNDKIAALNYERVQKMDLYRSMTPAILSYEGIQYQYMAPGVFNEEELAYIDEHLRILSGFYGILRPLDGVVPYRLEMQAQCKDWQFKSLYDFWEDKLAQNLFSESKTIVNLASKEYSRCISKYLKDGIQWITCVFGELVDGKVLEKGTFAKMARGEMVRFMAEKGITEVEEIKEFNRLAYRFCEDLSDENTYVFIKSK